MSSTADVKQLVERVIMQITAPESVVERKFRPESTYSWREPAPAAGLASALTVVKAAQQQAYKYALGLRGDGASWTQVADLLDVPWVEGAPRDEAAYELVLGPEPENAVLFGSRKVYWYCRGAGGCGEHIADHGPYNGYPSDNETGHAGDCRRHAEENDAYEKQQQLREERDRVADQAWDSLPEGFARDTVVRARKVLARGGRYGGWSTSETLAVALALNDDATLKRHHYSDRGDALDRVFQGTREPVEGRERWLATVRAAVTGVWDGR